MRNIKRATKLEKHTARDIKKQKSESLSVMSDYTVHGILQAKILQWVAIPSPGDLSNPRIELASLVPPALAGKVFTTVLLGKPNIYLNFK